MSSPTFAHLSRSTLLPQIAPTGDRVLVKIAEAEKKTAGGIILAESAQRKPTSGTFARHRFRLILT
jgi:hypothetical protein